MVTPSDWPLPSKEARPVTCGAMSFIPEPARSSWVTFRLTLTGVRAESVGLSGPAFPSRLRLPPPCTCAFSEKGNAVELEKSRSWIFTWSKARGFQCPTVLLRVTWPLLIFTSFTERSSGKRAEDGEAAAALDFAPKVEKFQLPEGACTSAMSG